MFLASAIRNMKVESLELKAICGNGRMIDVHNRTGGQETLAECRLSRPATIFPVAPNQQDHDKYLYLFDNNPRLEAH